MNTLYAGEEVQLAEKVAEKKDAHMGTFTHEDCTACILYFLRTVA